MKFDFMADHVLLERVRAFCLSHGLSYESFVEDATKDAAHEVRTRLKEMNGRSRLRARRAVFYGFSDDDGLRVMHEKYELGPMISRKLERKLAICELQSVSR